MRRITTGNALPALILSLAAAGCASSATGPDHCVGADVQLGAASCLVFEDGGRLGPQRAAIEETVEATFAAVGARIALDGVEIRVFAGRSTVIPELGLGGRADTRVIRLTFDPDSPHLEEAVTTSLFRLLAHEMHHTVRFREVGYASSLLEAFVSEGMADHFMLEVAGGDPPPWSVALRGAELDEWIGRAEEVWTSKDYDLDAWLFGTTPEIPRWAGYSIGFELVGRRIAAEPGASASTLVGAGAGGFAP